MIASRESQVYLKSLHKNHLGGQQDEQKEAYHPRMPFYVRKHGAPLLIFGHCSAKPPTTARPARAVRGFLVKTSICQMVPTSHIWGGGGANRAFYAPTCPWAGGHTSVCDFGLLV